MKNCVKMSYKVVVVLYLQIAAMFSAPVQLQVMPMQYGMQPQLPFLKNMVPNMQAPSAYPQQPLMFLLPNAAPKSDADTRYVNLNEPENNSLKINAGHIDEGKDAVVIDAIPKATEAETRNAVVYLPDEGRFSIGQIISYIPFLPIEVNVPDTISWITSILTGGWFRPQNPPASVGNVKRLSNAPVPVIVVPYPAPMPQV
ncbi:uncharacterized protein LOC113495319 [Trichoplusia ni]|uniref:Uncharacterized protein LOC113495319 n=1 Tax=Trichoplusia ni TaxID=7111 RepID=A0A7E5VND6_TRINI|nr:uncharacterized protein LOC113495319 [Trichoplusia ni]